MIESFDKCQPWVLIHEGGYVNHPKDPGGATNKGITQRVYDGYCQRFRLPTQHVRGISDKDVATIYKNQYWNAVRGDDLPKGLDYAVYDFAVNSGPSRAAKFLQKLVGVPQDGHIGDVTLGAVSENDAGELIKGICNARWSWLKRLRTFKTFGRGWTRRVMGEIIGAQERDTGVIDRAYRMHKELAVSAPLRSAEGKADGGYSLAGLINMLIALLKGMKR
jgi:lysozyme family protein